MSDRNSNTLKKKKFHLSGWKNEISEKIEKSPFWKKIYVFTFCWIILSPWFQNFFKLYMPLNARKPKLSFQDEDNNVLARFSKTRTITLHVGWAPVQRRALGSQNGVWVGGALVQRRDLGSQNGVWFTFYVVFLQKSDLSFCTRQQLHLKQHPWYTLVQCHLQPFISLCYRPFSNLKVRDVWKLEPLLLQT